MRESWTDERLDDLNTEVRDGFGRMDENFARIEERFTRIDEKFTRIDEKFEHVNGALLRIDGDLKSLGMQLNARLDSLQRTMIQFSGAMIVGLLGVLATRL